MPPETPTPTADAPLAHYVLKQGELVGPFQEAELRQGLEDGQFAPDDFVQIEGQEVWQPMAAILGMDHANLPGAVAPDWNSILKWAWFRLRHSIGEQSLVAGFASLAVGTVALLLSRWPFLFWLPWFGVALACALPLFRRKRPAHGGLLLASVVGIPLLFFLFSPGNSFHATSGASNPPAAAPNLTPGPRPSATPVTAAANPEPRPTERPAVPQPPAPKSAPLKPAPDAVPAAPAPVQLTPHYAAVPTEATPAPVAPPKPVAETNPASPNPAPAPVAAGPRRNVDFVREHQDALAIIKGNEGSGSAFICKMGNGTVLFTNVHVVADITGPTITRVDGALLKAGAADLAAGRDIARIALSQPSEHPLEIIADFDKKVRMGDDVVVLGNSGGGGGVTKLDGRIVSVGPDRIEVSAEFIPGNSGSPIIHVKTGQVIGIASGLTKRYDDFSSAKPAAEKTSIVRRTCYRIDNVSAWEPLEWNEFHAEGVLLKNISTLTGDIFDFLADLRAGKQPNFATETLRYPAQEWLGSKQNKHLSEVDRTNSTRQFLNSLRTMVRSDINAAAARVRHSYFQEELKTETRVRDELYNGFDKESSRISAPSSQPKPVRKK